ncbi:5-methyltetrahydropteroyltriglutamate--homocysteine S-methyltransferase [Pelagibacteraceae bacterium]|nr:5-methyltetrahydropteroyltriglutamate--homocysteine S-methyltransferase [Pelagibacteraceae bacterium]
MITTATIGYPRIGPKRELKKALESFWKGDIKENELQSTAKDLRKKNWEIQKENGIDLITSNDFSFYDQVLDTICLLGAVPDRYNWQGDDVDLKTYFAMARGSQTKELDVSALEMTKWFDTNYHYLVPELKSDQKFKISSQKPFEEFKEAQSAGYKTKPVLLGPITFLLLSKSTEGKNTLDLLDNLLPAYLEIVKKLNDLGAEWIQIDEPIFVKDLDEGVVLKIKKTLNSIKEAAGNSKILLTTYFESIDQKVKEKIFASDVDAVHLDLVRGENNFNYIKDSNKTLSLGVINGRNIWRSDLTQIIDQIKDVKGDFIISSSCPLLHTPYDLDLETKVPENIKKWLAFAKQKLQEINILKQNINHGEAKSDLTDNKACIEERKKSSLIHDDNVKARVKTINEDTLNRQSKYEDRAKIQRDIFNLPLYPTTTIGSFPQTKDVRQARAKNRKGELSNEDYDKFLEDKTIEAIKRQEELGIDVIVHGEFERNDMVEYFGENLRGFTFTSSGFVQSYGSRCVKPPIIFGDVSRPEPMTVRWSKFAQKQTSSIVKGMLTGPITILQWSFVRDDQPGQTTAEQIAFAIRDEVADLESNGIRMIQIDEPALREGLPLKTKDWDEYLKWSVNAFRISAAVVKNETQIHTHMCYAEFEDIIDSIAALDADVISIETSRSRMELLKTFEKFKYPNEIGPGVYDIHSPRVPKKDEMVELIKKASKQIDPKRLWVNPDCGLKTRGWPETIDALKEMVSAAKELRG